MTDDLVGGDCLDQLDLVVCLEVGHLVLDLTDDLEVGAAEHELSVDVDRGGDLAYGVLDEQDHAALQRRLQINPAVMLNKERNLALIIRALQIDVASHQVCAADGSVFQIFVYL